MSAQEIVDALHSHLAVLDRDGNITHVNEAWVRFSEERGALPSSTGVGVNYFAVCRARGATPEVEEMLAGIRDVINEAIPQFRAEYTCNTPKEAYWYELMVKPLPKPHRGAVVYHTDITELKKAREEYAVILNGARGILWRANYPDFKPSSPANTWKLFWAIQFRLGLPSPICGSIAYIRKTASGCWHLRREPRKRDEVTISSTA